MDSKITGSKFNRSSIVLETVRKKTSSTKIYLLTAIRES